MKITFKKNGKKDSYSLVIDGIELKAPFVWKINDHDVKGELNYACILDIRDTSRANADTMKCFYKLEDAKRYLVEQYTEKHFTR